MAGWFVALDADRGMLIAALLYNAPSVFPFPGGFMPKSRCWLALSVIILFTISYSQAQLDNSDKQLARDVFQQLIDINTTESVGSTTVAAQAMANRLRDAGFPARDVVVLSPAQRHGHM